MPDEEQQPTPEEIAHHRAMAMATQIMQILPGDMPETSLRAACYLTASLASTFDHAQNIGRPPPELGLTWLDASKALVDRVYEANAGALAMLEKHEGEGEVQV